MMNLREFLRINNLKQVELARYLGVTEAAISNAVKGKSRFSDENLIKIKNNPYGWDTSMLVEGNSNVAAEDPEITGNPLVDYLQRKIKELEKEKADLLQENAVLRYENRVLSRNKGEDAIDVISSSSADAV